MTLNTRPTFPSTGCYVLKLRLDVLPQSGRLCGRLEHIASGDTFDFASGAALEAVLLQHAAKVYAAVIDRTAPAGRDR